MTREDENTLTTPHNCRTCGGRGVITVYTEVRMDSFGAFGVGAHQVNCPDCSSFETGMVYNRPMTRADAERFKRLMRRHSCYNTAADWDWLALYGVNRASYLPAVDLGKGAPDGARYFWRDMSASQKTSK